MKEIYRTTMMLQCTIQVWNSGSLKFVCCHQENSEMHDNLASHFYFDIATLRVFYRTMAASMNYLIVKYSSFQLNYYFGSV